MPRFARRSGWCSGGAGRTRLGLARGAAKAGDRAAAAQEYVRILQIVPDQPEARRELARLNR
jgi:Tfp pilus assembly protein PilF